MVVHLLLPAIHTVKPFMFVYTECHTYADLLTWTSLLKLLPVSNATNMPSSTFRCNFRGFLEFSQMGITCILAYIWVYYNFMTFNSMVFLYLGL